MTEARRSENNRSMSSNGTFVVLHKIMDVSVGMLKEKNMEDVCYFLKDKLMKINDNSVVRDIVFEACCAEFSEEKDTDLALRDLLKNTIDSIEKKQSNYDVYVNNVIEEFEGNRQVTEYYIEDFFKQYHSNPSHTSIDIVEMASLSALKNHKPTLDRVRESLVNEILQGADEATFSFVSVVSVEGLAVAIQLFPPEYLHDQNECLINIVVRVIEVVAERALSYDEHEKRRLMIAIRNMVEGVASSQSLERTQQSTSEYSDGIVNFIKEKIPENPCRTLMIFQEWLKKSGRDKANGLLDLAGETVSATNHNPGITQEQQTKLNQAVDKLYLLADGQPRLFSYIHAGIKAEISNIPIQGQASSLEQLVNTIWHAAMIAKSVTLIVTSSGALLVQEGVALVDHLIALIPKTSEKPQEWNKYAKDLRALRAQASKLVSAQFSAQIIKYCIKLIESGVTNLNLEYEIFRSMNIALKSCEDKSINVHAVQAVAFLLKGERFIEDKDLRRQQALNMMLDFMTCSNSDIIHEAYTQIKKLQNDYASAMYNLIRNTWGNKHIRSIDLTTYNNKAKMGENTAHAQLAYDDEVNIKSAFVVSTLVASARKERFKFQDAIATLTREHQRLVKSNEGLYLSVNGHNDPENTNSNEWVNIIGEFWKFLENEKLAFILHGALSTGKRAMVEHLVDLLLRYRRFGSLYPVRIHLKNLTGTDIVQQALQAEGWSQNRIEELRQRFSVKASSIATRQTPDPALPELLLIIIGVGALDCPPQFMQHIKERWGREFKCLLVTGMGAFGLSDYANIFSTLMTKKQVREKVQEFFIQPQVTREQLAVTLSYDAATREYRHWMKIRPFMTSFSAYIPQETNDAMAAKEDFPAAASWVKKHYQCVFSENAWLRDLATTPVMLRMLIRMVPKLFAEKRFQKAVSREEFLHVFIQTIFEEKLGNLKKDEVGYHFSDKRSHHFFILYSRKAALHILRHKRPLACYGDEAVMESSAKKQVMETDKIFFDATNSAAKYGFLLSPLVLLADGKYEFINTEVWAYFAIEGLYYEIIDCVHGNLGSDSILNNTLLYDTRDVFRGLLHHIRSDTKAQAALYKIVLATKTNKALDIAASNAMTLLVRIRSFSGNKELAGASFSKANLNGGIFDFSCLDGVNMQEASIERCDFSHASAHHAKMGKVKLREPDTYKIGETIAHAAFSEDGHVILLACDSGSIACYRDKELTTKQAIYFAPGFRNGMTDRCKETNQIAAVAKGWLEVWNIGTKATAVGPSFISEHYGKAQSLLFCQDGSKILVMSLSHMLIYNLHQLKSGNELNQPQLILPKDDKWGFKLSCDGKKVAYFFYHRSNKTVQYRVTDVASGDLLNEGLVPTGGLSFDSYTLIWLGRIDMLLIQANHQTILCDHRQSPHLYKTKHIRSARYQLFENRGMIVFLCEDNRLEEIRFDDIDASNSVVLSEAAQTDFDRERKYIFLENILVEQIKHAVSNINEHYEHVVVERHEISSDQKHVILGAYEGDNWSIYSFNIEHQIWLPKIDIQSSWLDLECIDLVRNKLIIYQHWKQVYLFDLDNSTQQPIMYNLYTDLNIDNQHGLIDFVADVSKEEEGGHSVLLDLDTLQEIAIIPQDAGIVSLASSNPLIFHVQRTGIAYQLEINNDDVLMKAIARRSDSFVEAMTEARLHNKSSDQIKQDTVLMAKDGNGLVAVAEKGGRLRLERHYSDGTINPLESRLYNVPDIVALNFLQDNQGNSHDTEAVIVVCADGTIIFWNFDSNTQEERLGSGHDSKIVGVIYSSAYECTFTLDITGHLIKWNKSGENQTVRLFGKATEMVLSPSGKHIYLFNQQDGMVYKLNIKEPRDPVKSWSEVKQYCVMRLDGAFIYLTQSGTLISERTRINEVGETRIERQEFNGQGKVMSIYYLHEADRLMVNVASSIRNLSINITKLLVCSDSTLSRFDAEYVKQRYCHTTNDGSFMITRSVQGKFFMHKLGGAPVEITNVMLNDVDRIKGIKLVAGKVFVHYLDNSLRIWDYTQQKVSHEAIENVDEYFIGSSHHLLLVRQGMALLLYRASCKPDAAPRLLPLYTGIHEVYGCVWLNETTFASFHTNHAVKVWKVQQDSCQQLHVLGSHRFYCKDMSGCDMDISQALQYRLNMRGANLNSVEPAVHKQTSSLEIISSTVDELKKQNQLLLSQIAHLTFLYAPPASLVKGAAATEVHRNPEVSAQHCPIV